MGRHSTFSYYPFNVDVLDLFKETDAKEIHDKIIISTAKLVKAHAPTTKDDELNRLDEVKRLW